MPEFAGAAFHTGPLSVRLDDVTYTVDPLTAAGWLRVLPWEGWPLLLFNEHFSSRSRDRVLDRLTAGTWTRADVVGLGRAALAEAAGRPWWEAERLAAWSLQKHVLGAVLAKGTDPERLTLAAFLAVTEHLVMSGLDEMRRAQAEAELMMPPPEEIRNQPEEDLSTTVARMRGLPGVRLG